MHAIDTVQLQNSILRKLALKGIGVRDLERRAGLKYSVVQNILHGRSKNPTIKVIQKISKELGCSIEELLDGNECETSELFAEKNHKKNSMPDPVLNATKDQNSEIPWNADLWLDATLVLKTIIEQKMLSISKEEAQLCIDEIYKYSNGISAKADPRFAEWIIDRFLAQRSSKKLEQGLKDAAEGRLIKKGSFAKFASDEVE